MLSWFRMNRRRITITMNMATFTATFRTFHPMYARSKMSAIANHTGIWIMIT